ncbi:hypothetical protein Tco_0511377 [Tanacetum coccineum]
MDITSKSVKNLVLCGFSNLGDEIVDIIEINAPCISALTIQRSLLLWKIVLLNVSSLVEANLDYTKDGVFVTSPKDEEEELLKGLILSLCHVKELKLGIFCSKVLSRLEAKGFTVPSNMKYLDILPAVYSFSLIWKLKDDLNLDWHVPYVVKINAPHILSLTIEDELKLGKAVLLNVSSLVEAKLDYYYESDEPAREDESDEPTSDDESDEPTSEDECDWPASWKKREEILKAFSLLYSVCRLAHLEAKGFTFPLNNDWSHNDSAESED